MTPLSKGKVAKQARVNIPEGTFEDHHGRQGFAGKYAMLYRTHPPVEWARIEGPMRPRATRTYEIEPSDLHDPRGESAILLQNADIRIGISRRNEAMPFFVRNLDGDEVHFMHRGTGRLETDFGPLTYEPGDYLVIPKGTNYRLAPDGPDHFSLVLETTGEVDFPPRGPMGHHAPFDFGMLVTPEPEPQAVDGREYEVRIKRHGQYTSVFYPFHPLDVVGWQGTLTVFKLNIRDIRSVGSERIHLPPSMHCTMIATGITICTFTPRRFESDPAASRVPAYHRNVDYDEVVFTHSGAMFSRTREQSTGGILTFHPQGVHHGPSRRAAEAAKKAEQAEMYAVMVETERSLEPTPWFEQAEMKDYVESFRAR
jgi:homogentisate 1,2-dioxygenase